jgi:uncharacterized protein
MAAEARIWPDYFKEESRLQREGTVLERASHRLRHNFGLFLTLPGLIYGSNAFLMFLLGLLAFRHGALQDPRQHRELLLLVIVFGSVALLVGGGAVELPPLKMESSRARAAYATLLYNVYNEQLMGLAYAAALLLALASWRSMTVLGRLLALPGRMSLTTYVTQIAVLQVFFFPYLLGLEPPRIVALAGALALFALQVLASAWWLRRFDQGPLEWLWRCGSRGRWEPLGRELRDAA